MPQTEVKQSLDLSIELLEPQTRLYGGSVILGHVVRRSHIVAPLVTIIVRLLGRAKAKVSYIDEGLYNYDRTRFNFWPESAITNVIHEGPIHIAPGGNEHQAWAFALTLPTHTDARYLDASVGYNEKEACFLPPSGRLGPAGRIPEQPLPESFYFVHHKSSYEWHGFVEYWIEAEMVLQGKGPVVKATLPVNVLSLPTPVPPINSFGLVRSEITGCVRTQRLLPGMEQEELSFRQKTQKFFGSSKVPTFHYTLSVQYPTVIQMGSNSSIPFLLNINPNKEKTTGIIKDLPQIVTLQNIQLELRSTTSVFFTNTTNSYKRKKKQKMLLVRRSSLIPAHEDKMVLPSGGNEEPLDLGAVLDLRVDALGQVLHGTTKVWDCLGMKVSPTFLTYCVKVEHVLRWEMHLSVAREMWKCGGMEKVIILKPQHSVQDGQ
ncbi:hypothetical protein EsH8_I_000033 [Colletotrichum jinshuiense]